MIRSPWPRAAARWALFLATPFVMLSWLAPLVGSRTIGNDYLVYSIQDQLELMWSVRHGTFPLYLPGFASGHSASAATMGQLYHPISWLAQALPGYWRGHALECNTFLRLLSLGIAQLALYRLARRMGVARLPSFASTFVAVYNLRMLDSFRFGAALEGYTGMLFVAAAAGHSYLEERARAPVAFVGASCFLLLVSGHPQWVCYGSLAAGAFALLFPWIAAALDPAIPPPDPPRLRRYAARLVLGVTGGVLLASPCLLTFFFECYRTNADRVTPDYAWTLLFSDTPAGQLSNFLRPLRADVDGAFGGSALFALAALLPAAALTRRKPPAVLWALYGSALLAFLFALGESTPVHAGLVRAVPLLGSFRVPGRSVLWIPLACFPLVAWLLSEANRGALRACAAAALPFYGWTWLRIGASLPASRYSPVEILGGQLPPQVEGLLLHLSGATLLLLLLAAAWPRRAHVAVVFACLCVVSTTWLCLRYGTWRAERPLTRTAEQITAERRASVRVSLDAGEGMALRRVVAYRQRGLTPRRPLATIEHAAQRVDSEQQILERLASEHRPPLLVAATVAPRSDQVLARYDDVRLTHNTHNRFVFEVLAATDGYVVLGLPWLDGFEASVDGRPADLTRANALFPAVFVPPGRHRVELRFVSRPFLVGLGAAMLGLSLWIVWLTPRRRLAALVVALTLDAALAAGFHRALLGGPSFGSDFRWRSDPGSPAPAAVDP